MSRGRIIAMVALALGAGSASALASEESEPEYEMTTYQLVLLRKGPDWRPMGEREIQSHQETHLKYLKSLLDANQAIIAGPLDGSEELREIVVLDVGSVEAAASVMAEDSWVRVGRLEAEIHPWWTAKGIVQDTDEFQYQETCYLGLLKRPENAPEYPEEKLREIQAGHLANIRRMADSGDLVLAGPIGDEGRLRGIFVFRRTDPETITKQVAEDPAIKAGRLEMELYPWNVPRGSLPPRPAP